MVTVDDEAVDYGRLPQFCRESVSRYVEQGLPPGSTWFAIFSGDLRAVLLADDETRDALPTIVRWLHNYAPSRAWGSPEAVQQWMNERRAERLAERNAHVAEPVRSVINEFSQLHGWPAAGEGDVL